MSYDIVVFEKSKAPADTAEFLGWYEKQTEWGGVNTVMGRNQIPAQFA